MTFVGTNPLSELVCSPQQSLSLRCADGSFFKKKPYVILCAERSDIVGASRVEKVINQAKIANSPATLNMRSEGSRKDSPINLITDSFKADAAENDSTSVKPAILDGRHYEEDDEADTMKKTEDLVASEVHPVKEYDGYISKLQMGTSTNKGCEVTQSLKPESKINSDPGPSGFHCLEKWESTAENDLQTPLGENTCSVAIKIIPSESSAEVRINSQPDIGLLAGGRALASNESLGGGRIQRYQMKGKEKALSNGFANGRMSNEEDNSHESVESCNSAALFSAGKTRRSFEQSPIVVSKRLKKQIQDSPCSSSPVKQDSSFMNWIANMMKGFLRSEENAVPSLALTLANPDHGYKVPERLLACNGKREPADRPMGFQSFFGSLYRPKGKAQDTVALNPCNVTAESRQSDLNDNACDVSPMPITCHNTTGSIYTQVKLANEKFNEPVFGKGVDLVVQAKNTSPSFAAHHEIGRSVSVGNQNSLNLATDKHRVGTISDSSQDKHEAELVKNIDSRPSSDGKTNQVFCSYKSDPMKSLWITRFTPKVSVPLPNQDLRNQSTSVAPVCSTGAMGLKNAIQNHHSSLNADKELKNREHLAEVSPLSHNCGTDAETTLGTSKVKSFDDERSACQVDPILPSPRIKHSEAMASVFAKRLDALKHIMPSDATDKLPSEARNPAEPGASFVCECGPSKLPPKMGNASNVRPLNVEENKFQDDNAPTICHGNYSLEGKYSNWKPNEDASLQHEASGSKGHKSKINSFTRCSPFDKQISNVPKSIFDAVKRLQLSRTDVLKWMHSHMPLSHLDGFFLRLRLGKRESGLGGTGYHVACITGVQREILQQDSTNSIAVDVGGINCLVESQYISNQDFLEDELIAWWSSTSKGGGKVPSPEDLKLKFEEKKLLGLYENKILAKWVQNTP